MERRKTNELSSHCDEVQEIMGTIPSWIVRWGILAILLILLMTVFGCCIIKYPHIQYATISISSSLPSAHLTSKYTGIVDTILVSDGQRVSQGEIIALFSNASCYEDIQAIKQFVDDNQNHNIKDVYRSPIFIKKLCLGDIQPIWAELSATVNEYNSFICLSEYSNKTRKIKRQLQQGEQQLMHLDQQKELLRKDIYLQECAFKRDSTLFAKGLISQYDYEVAQQSYLTKLNSFIAFESSVLTSSFNFFELSQNIVDIEIQKKKDENQHNIRFQKLIQQIDAQIEAWYNTYAIISPIQGAVSLQECWGKGQHISYGDVVASVVPISEDKIEGRMNVSSAGFGHLSTGQRVNVKLNGFGYMEYGVLRGAIKHIANAPERNIDGSISYRVVVEFPEGMISSYGKTIPLIQEMDGTAEIITKEMRLIEHFIQPLMAMLKK